MDNTQLRTLLTKIQAAGAANQADLAAALAMIPPDATVVRAGDNLQAALDKGGAVQIEKGAIFEGTFVLKVPATRLIGDAGVQLKGSASAPPSTSRRARTMWRSRPSRRRRAGTSR